MVLQLGIHTTSTLAMHARDAHWIIQATADFLTTDLPKMDLPSWLRSWPLIGQKLARKGDKSRGSSHWGIQWDTVTLLLIATMDCSQRAGCFYRIQRCYLRSHLQIDKEVGVTKGQQQTGLALRHIHFMT